MHYIYFEITFYETICEQPPKNRTEGHQYCVYSVNYSLYFMEMYFSEPFINP